MYGGGKALGGTGPQGCSSWLGGSEGLRSHPSYGHTVRKSPSEHEADPHQTPDLAALDLELFSSQNHEEDISVV